jgi:succinate dehydrogenase / fumarate reductase cytochrome b subunit
MVIAGFRNPVIVTLYVAAQLALFVHLVHGVQSSLQTLGLKNRRTGRAIWWLGFLVALTVLVGNLAIVFAVMFGWVPPVAKVA